MGALLEGGFGPAVQTGSAEEQAGKCCGTNSSLEVPRLVSWSKLISQISTVIAITEKLLNFNFPSCCKEWSEGFMMYSIVTRFTFSRVFCLTCFRFPSWLPLLSFTDGVCASSPSACVGCSVDVTYLWANRKMVDTYPWPILKVTFHWSETTVSYYWLAHLPIVASHNICLHNFQIVYILITPKTINFSECPDIESHH